MANKTTSKIQALKDADTLRFMSSIWASDKKVIAVKGSYEKEIIGYKKVSGKHFFILSDDHLVEFKDLEEYRIESAYFTIDSQTNES